MHRCNNCCTVWCEAELEEIADYYQRVEPGGTVPSGECPDVNCGALCYPDNRVTKDEVQAAYIRQRTRAIIYDAKNSTSFEDEIKRLVEMAYGKMSKAAMLAELESEECLNQKL